MPIGPLRDHTRYTCDGEDMVQPTILQRVLGKTKCGMLSRGSQVRILPGPQKFAAANF